MQEKIYLHALGLIDQIGTKKIELLKQYFHSLEEAWNASGYKLKKAGLTEKTIQVLLKQRNSINPKKEFQKINPEIILIAQKDPEYPAQLKEIHDPPQLLYCLGNIKLLKENSLAVVGSRAMTEYGKRVCAVIVESLPLTIVSGLATGIDTIAHQNSLKRSIAVLGSGINPECIFPAENRSLVQRLLNSNSLVLSEYAPYLMARREFFPMRNRIISGLSLGTLVIEAGEKSGALITAHQALEQNRSVMAIPGTIYNRMSEGTNKLIQRGAKLVQTGQDIIDELNLGLSVDNSSIIDVKDLSKEEYLVLKNLSREPIALDKILKSTRLNASQLFSNLTLLEIKGLVKNLGNNKFVLWQKN